MRANSDPIAILRSLEERRVAIEQHFGALLQACGEYSRRDQEAVSAFFNTYSLEALHKLIAARALVDSARSVGAILDQQRQSSDLTGSQFRTEHPDYRKVLNDAAQYRMRLAKRTLEEVIVAEKRHLSKQGLEDEIDNAPAVKRARHEVKKWERILKSVGEDDEADVWKPNCHQLLDGQ